MKRAEVLAIEYFIKWVGNRGILTDTSRRGVGYDFIVKWRKSGKNEKYEVKGTKKPLKIPDMHVNEFDKHKRLKADYIFVVSNVHSAGKEICYKIPRNALTKENLRLKQTYHIRLFQNKNKMGRYQLHI